MANGRRLTMRERRRARPISGLLTWRLALAFFGTAGAYVIFDATYVAYIRKGEGSPFAVTGFPICIALVCWVGAYGRYVYRRLRGRR
jgi:hypothetical protein